MTKARILANLISDNAELADGQISVAEVVGAAPLASPTFTGTASGTFSGPLTGNVTGNLTGNVNTTLIASPTLNATVNIKTTDSNGEGIGLGIDADKKVRFYDDQGASTKMYWNASTVTQKFEDNSKLAFGSSEDLKLYHDGTNKLVGDLTQTGKLTTDATDLSALAATISDTAVDVFVYDTRKDSDGGAWRKRTQHTSWYNETLNTATRGARKEFPSVAVIVAESNQVTIYDGDDPDLPMWMVFNSASNYFLNQPTVSAVTMLNGKLAVTGTASNHTSLAIGDFVSEFCQIIRSNYDGDATGLVNRNQSFWSSDKGNTRIVNNVVNDVAMTVLPNAPIDAATGLPVPTIAVATDGGVSVIKDDGTVVDVNDSLGGTRPTDHLVIRGNDITIYNRNNGTVQQFFDALNLSTDSTNDCKYNYTYNGGGGGTENVTAILRDTIGGTVLVEGGETYKDLNVANADGVSKIHDGNDREFSAGAFSIFDSSVAYVTSSYNTGWQNGAIKLATLSDTSTTNVTGSELVTNGDFSSATGWTAQSGWSISGGTASCNGSNGAFLYQTSGFPANTKVTISFDITSYTSGSVRAGSQGVGPSSTFSSVGSHSVTYTTSSTATQGIEMYSINFVGTIDNVSARVSEADRSVNNNGLQVFGTVTKSAVATGADLVGYSGFTDSNYLLQPYNTDLQFGVGNFSIHIWMKTTGTATRYLYSNYNNSDGGGFAAYMVSNGTLNGWVNSPNTTYAVNSTRTINDGAWHLVSFIRSETTINLYIDGDFEVSGTIPVGSNLSVLNSEPLTIGNYSNSNYAWQGSLALFRISATAPSPEQIAKIYEDEKHLFQTGAQATLYGSSDAVTALAYDDSTELLHVGTSAGRSVFQGLRRVDNTTDAVGAAISASNGLVAED